MNRREQILTRRRAIVFLVAFLISFPVVFSGVDKGIKVISNVNEQPVETQSERKPNIIMLQDIVEQWLSTVNSNSGIYIYDLDNDIELAKYQEDTTFNTASIYKLFVAYQGYKLIENGSINANEPYWNGFTRRECLDKMIRESHSPCAETMWTEFGKSEMDRIISEEWNIKNTRISGLASTPKDVAEMLKIYYRHEDLSDETWTKIQDSMLNQPFTTDDWRQGLPKGFSTATVYNKVGWEWSGSGNIWNLYHDAAIVSFPSDNETKRHNYIIVSMNKTVNPNDIARLGRMIENEVLQN